MRRTFLSLVTFVAALGCSQLRATIYNDSIGDVFTGAGGGILDITSVEVTNNASDIFFTISLNGPIASPNDWGNYMVGIDSGPGGDTATPVGNPWSRPISMSGGMNYWLGSWVNGGGGAQLWTYSGSWSGPGAAAVESFGSQNFTIKASLAALGLSPGNSFNFDVYSSGADGNPGAIDSLSNPNQTINDWGVAYQNGPVSIYTVTPVPEPGLLSLVGLGGLILFQRVFRRRV